MAVLFDGELFADYHQFYIADLAGQLEIPTEWSSEAISDRVLSANGILSVCTVRNMMVPVRIELHEERPAIEFDEVDHVVMAPLVTQGEIVIAGCTDYLPSAARASVAAGDLCVIVVMSGLGTLSEDGLEGEDRYVIHLWPGSMREISVLKQWKAH